MNMGPNTVLWSVLGLGVLVVVGAGIHHSSEVLPSTSGHTSSGPVQDAFMTEVRALQFDAEGHPHQRITVKQWSHVLQANHSELEGPELYLKRSNQHLWHVHAQRGLGFHPDVATSLEFLELHHDVVVNYLEHQDARPSWCLRSDQLLIYPKRAQTQSHVAVTGPHGMRVGAEGFQASLEQGHIDFLASVVADYPLMGHEQATRPITLLQVTSDQAHLNTNTSTLTHTGDVHLTQESRAMRGDRLVVQRDASGALAYVVTEGTPATFSGQVVEHRDETTHAQAASIRYEPLAQRLLLSGEAQIQQGHDFFSGDLITYHLDTGAVRTQGRGEERTHLILKTR